MLPVVFSLKDNIITLFSCADYGPSLLWNTKTYEIVQKLESLHGPAFTLTKYMIEGTTYLAGGGEGIIKLWNISASKHIVTFKAHDGYVGVLETFNDNETPYLASGRKGLTYKNLESQLK